ncbi:MAG: hypothetical protein ACLFVG_07065 [Candidatus Aminicenantes bacterium]
MPYLDSIPLRLGVNDIIKELRLENKNPSIDIQELLEKSKLLISPKLLYEVSYITKKEKDQVEIEKVTFTSRVLSLNLQKVEKVFPYVITIGKALENKASSSNDLLKQYYLENIGDEALRLLEKYLENHIRQNYGIKKLASMSPGSLENWPVTEQKPLFSLFGRELDLVGVTLTESMLMIPRKSISGILFPTEVTFSSCQLCPRKRCPERKASYDQNLRKKYGLTNE